MLSDLAVGQEILRANVAANGLDEGRSVEVGVLDWTAADQPLLAGRHFDLIIASECLYDAEMVVPLLRTAHRACSENGTLLLAGMIGGETVRLFRQHWCRFFAECIALPPPRGCRDDEPPPTPRAIHRISLPCSTVVPETPSELTHLLGSGLWPAAMALAHALEKHADWRALLDGAHVIELGAGSTGYVGIAAARSGGARTRVVITDKHEALVACAAEAVLDNHLQSQCTARVFAWGEPSPLQREAFDVILASDCLYSHGVAGAFCDALDELVRPHTRVLISCEQRWSTGECLEVCAERGWDATAVGEPFVPTSEELAQVDQRIREQGVADARCQVYELTRSVAVDEQRILGQASIAGMAVESAVCVTDAADTLHPEASTLSCINRFPRVLLTASRAPCAHGRVRGWHASCSSLRSRRRAVAHKRRHCCASHHGSEWGAV